MSRPSPWHLDKKVSIGIIGAILFQCGSFIWYGSHINDQVQITTERVAALTAWKDKQDDDKAKIEAHLAVMDERLSDQGKTLQRIDDRLDRAINHTP